MKRMLAVLAVLFLMYWPIAGRAQVADPVVASQAVNPQSEHNYIGIGGETVNPADGSVNFTLPIQPPPGRGLTMPFSIRYSSPESFYVSNAICNSGGDDCTSGNNVGWQYPARAQANSFAVNGWTYVVPNLMFTDQMLQDITQNCGNGNYKEMVTYMTTNYTFQGLDGVSRPLDIATGFIDPQRYGCQPASGGTGPDVSNVHGYLATMQYPTTSSASMPTLTVTDPSGTTYQFTSQAVLTAEGQGMAEDPIPSFAQVFTLTPTITDRNGNQIVINANSYTDSLGRAALTWTGPSGSGLDTVTVAGVSGNIVVNWKTPWSVTLPLNGTPIDNSPPVCVLNTGPTTMGGISDIDLPNGQKYTFLYDSTYGRISKITFPDGGYVSYTWQPPMLPNNQPGGVADGIQTVSGPVMYMSANGGTANAGSVYCDFQYYKPAIMERDVSYDGKTVALKQTFSYTTQFGSPSNLTDRYWTAKSTTVTTTDLVSNQTSKTVYNYIPMASDSTASNGYTAMVPEVPVESSVVTQDATATKTVYKTWVDSMTESAEQTVLSNSPGTTTAGTTTVRCYNADEQVTEVDEFGLSSELGGASAPSFPGCYSPGVPVFGQQIGSTTLQQYLGPDERVTNTAYQYNWSLPANYTQPGYDGSISGAHIVNAPSSVTVSDSVRNITRTTTYAYADSDTPSSTGAVKLIPATTFRGNIKSVTRGSSSDNSLSTTSYTYYDTGQVASKKDGCGNIGCSDMTGTNHTTTYVYADPAGCTTGCAQPSGQTNAYITSVTYPDGTGKSFSWDYPTGQLLSATDENNNITSYQYSDVLGRVTQVTYPDGGQSNFSYNDASYNPSSTPANNTPNITTTELINSSTSTKVQTIAARDGMGHTVRTIVTNPGATETEYTDTIYNGMGDVASVSNPYRSTSDSTYGITSYLYDVLGRKIYQCNQDIGLSGSTACSSAYFSQSWVYNGNVTTWTNENRNATQYTNDGLGRLKTVVEPGSLVTNYTHDAFGDLLTVNQQGNTSNNDVARNRSFNYDSLSRLLCASNPESSTAACPSTPSSYVTGTTGYVYDTNGNLSSRTDARGVTTSYKYDVANRLLWKTYSNAPAGSLSSCYQYQYGSGNNAEGRLVNEWTQAGNCASTPPSNSQSLRAIASYDAMGRVTAEQQCVAGFCTLASPQQPSANCASLPNAAGLQYCYDNAGNLLAYSNGLTTANVSSSYSQQALRFAQTFDSVNRLTAVTSSWSDSTHPATLFTAQSFTPWNAQSSWQLGNSLLTGRGYDIRMRVCQQLSSLQPIPSMSCPQ